MALVQKYFSFAEIIQGRDADVRVTEDGLFYAVDLVMVMTGQNRDHAGKTLRNIPEDTFPSEKISDRKMPGKGNGHTKLLTFQNALELVMVLPGQLAKDTRTQFANIIRRYLAGDHTLISEIQSNAKSASPIAQMARESLCISTEDDMRRKRQKQEIDMVAAKQQSIITFIDTMERLDPDWKKDTRLVMQTKDHLKNVTLGLHAIEGTAQSKDPIYITEVAKALGYPKLSHGETCIIGKKSAELYRAQHDADPPKRKQYVDGAERTVSAYTEAERDIIERAIRAVMSR